MRTMLYGIGAMGLVIFFPALPKALHYGYRQPVSK